MIQPTINLTIDDQSFQVTDLPQSIQELVEIFDAARLAERKAAVESSIAARAIIQLQHQLSEEMKTFMAANAPPDQNVPSDSVNATDVVPTKPASKKASKKIGN